MASINELPKDIRFLCEWTHDFDRLLSDRFALKLFAQFLKKEYSYENLKFWLSCKKYKNICDKQKRMETARHIFDKYLKPGAEQAVNIDSRALISVESQLEDPKPDLFSIPEKQVYDLMKMDCYKRFLESFYSNNVNESLFHEKLSEKVNRTENKDTEQHFIGDKYRKNAYKKLKRLELNEINRKIAKRKILRNLSPKKRLMNRSEDKQSLLSTPECHRMKCERMQRSTQMESIQWIQSNMSSTKPKLNNSSLSSNEKIRSLIIVFTNGSQEKVDLYKSETIKHLLERILKKRNLNFTSFEAYPIGSEKELDLNSDVMDLRCGRIRVEQRVVFDIKLPNGLSVNIKSKPTTMSAKVLNPILTEFNRKYDPEYYEIRFTDNWQRLEAETPIFCADNRKLVVLYQGVNECKSIRTESTLKTDFPSIYQKERQNLKEFLGKENKIHLNSKQKKNKEFLNISDISFSDDFKTEEFLNDLMRSSQTVPKEKKELRLSPKPNSIDSVKNLDNKQNILQNIMFLSESMSEKSSQKTPNKRPINSPKLKVIDFKKKSPPLLKSDQLYDKKFVRRVDKVVDPDGKYSPNKNCGHFPKTSEQIMKSNSIKTLSKFHKTSSEKLLNKTRNEMPNKIPVEFPQIFNLK